MNTDQDLTTRLSQGERMDSVTIQDLEAQNSNTNNGTCEILETPLRGILKRPDHDLSLNDDRVSLILIKLCSTLLILVLMVPLIVADLYFGFIDSSCVKEEPNNLAISMNLYLVVSGFTGMGTMFYLLISICCLSNDENSVAINLFCLTCSSWILGAFHIIWNILGAIVFWGTVYGKDICDKNVSTYIYVSLIIKFVGTALSLLQQNQKKNK